MSVGSFLSHFGNCACAFVVVFFFHSFQSWNLSALNNAIPYHTNGGYPIQLTSSGLQNLCFLLIIVVSHIAAVCLAPRINSFGIVTTRHHLTDSNWAYWISDTRCWNTMNENQYPNIYIDLCVWQQQTANKTKFRSERETDKKNQLKSTWILLFSRAEQKICWFTNIIGPFGIPYVIVQLRFGMLLFVELSSNNDAIEC